MMEFNEVYYQSNYTWAANGCYRFEDRFQNRHKHPGYPFQENYTRPPRPRPYHMPGPYYPPHRHVNVADRNGIRPKRKSHLRDVYRVNTEDGRFRGSNKSGIPPFYSNSNGELEHNTEHFSNSTNVLPNKRINLNLLAQESNSSRCENDSPNKSEVICESLDINDNSNSINETQTSNSRELVTESDNENDELAAIAALISEEENPKNNNCVPLLKVDSWSKTRIKLNEEQSTFILDLYDQLTSDENNITESCVVQSECHQNAQEENIKEDPANTMTKPKTCNNSPSIKESPKSSNQEKSQSHINITKYKIPRLKKDSMEEPALEKHSKTQKSHSEIAIHEPKKSNEHKSGALENKTEVQLQVSKRDKDKNKEDDKKRRHKTDKLKRSHSSMKNPESDKQDLKNLDKDSKEKVPSSKLKTTSSRESPKVDCEEPKIKKGRLEVHLQKLDSEVIKRLEKGNFNCQEAKKCCKDVAGVKQKYDEGKLKKPHSEVRVRESDKKTSKDLEKDKKQKCTETELNGAQPNEMEKTVSGDVETKQKIGDDKIKNNIQGLDEKVCKHPVKRHSKHKSSSSCKESTETQLHSSSAPQVANKKKRKSENSSTNSASPILKHRSSTESEEGKSTKKRERDESKKSSRKDSETVSKRRTSSEKEGKKHSSRHKNDSHKVTKVAKHEPEKSLKKSESQIQLSPRGTTEKPEDVPKTTQDKNERTTPKDASGEHSNRHKNESHGKITSKDVKLELKKLLQKVESQIHLSQRDAAEEPENSTKSNQNRNRRSTSKEASGEHPNRCKDESHVMLTSKDAKQEPEKSLKKIDSQIHLSPRGVTEEPEDLTTTNQNEPSHVKVLSKDANQEPEKSLKKTETQIQLSPKGAMEEPEDLTTTNQTKNERTTPKDASGEHSNRHKSGSHLKVASKEANREPEQSLMKIQNLIQLSPRGATEEPEDLTTTNQNYNGRTTPTDASEEHPSRHKSESHAKEMPKKDNQEPEKSLKGESQIQSSPRGVAEEPEDLPKTNQNNNERTTPKQASGDHSNRHKNDNHLKVPREPEEPLKKTESQNKLSPRDAVEQPEDLPKTDRNEIENHVIKRATLKDYLLNTKPNEIFVDLTLDDPIETQVVLTLKDAVEKQENPLEASLNKNRSSVQLAPMNAVEDPHDLLQILDNHLLDPKTGTITLYRSDDTLNTLLDLQATSAIIPSTDTEPVQLKSETNNCEIQSNIHTKTEIIQNINDNNLSAKNTEFSNETSHADSSTLSKIIEDILDNARSANKNSNISSNTNTSVTNTTGVLGGTLCTEANITTNLNPSVDRKNTSILDSTPRISVITKAANIFDGTQCTNSTQASSLITNTNPTSIKNATSYNTLCASATRISNNGTNKNLSMSANDAGVVDKTSCAGQIPNHSNAFMISLENMLPEINMGTSATNQSQGSTSATDSQVSKKKTNELAPAFSSLSSRTGTNMNGNEENCFMQPSAGSPSAAASTIYETISPGNNYGFVINSKEGRIAVELAGMSPPVSTPARSMHHPNLPVDNSTVQKSTETRNSKKGSTCASIALKDFSELMAPKPTSTESNTGSSNSSLLVMQAADIITKYFWLVTSMKRASNAFSSYMKQLGEQFTSDLARKIGEEHIACNNFHNSRSKKVCVTMVQDLSKINWEQRVYDYWDILNTVVKNVQHELPDLIANKIYTMIASMFRFAEDFNHPHLRNIYNASKNFNSTNSQVAAQGQLSPQQRDQLRDQIIVFNNITNQNCQPNIAAGLPITTRDHNAPGVPSNTTRGSTNVTIRHTGGPINVSMAPTNVTGVPRVIGPPNTTGGPLNTTVGPTYVSRGPPNVALLPINTNGVPLNMGPTINLTRGPSIIGPTIATGSPLNTTVGPSNVTRGFSNVTRNPNVFINPNSSTNSLSGSYPCPNSYLVKQGVMNPPPPYPHTTMHNNFNERNKMIANSVNGSTASNAGPCNLPGCSYLGHTESASSHIQKIASIQTSTSNTQNHPMYPIQGNSTVVNNANAAQTSVVNPNADVPGFRLNYQTYLIAKLLQDQTSAAHNAQTASFNMDPLRISPTQSSPTNNISSAVNNDAMHCQTMDKRKACSQPNSPTCLSSSRPSTVITTANTNTVTLKIGNHTGATMNVPADIPQPSPIVPMPRNEVNTADSNTNSQMSSTIPQNVASPIATTNKATSDVSPVAPKRSIDSKADSAASRNDPVNSPVSQVSTRISTDDPIGINSSISTETTAEHSTVENLDDEIVEIKCEYEDEETILLNQDVPKTVHADNDEDSSLDTNTNLQNYITMLIKAERTCVCKKPAEYVCLCKAAIYCSEECQKAEWNNHKPVCSYFSSKNNV